MALQIVCFSTDNYRHTTEPRSRPLSYSRRVPARSHARDSGYII